MVVSPSENLCTSAGDGEETSAVCFTLGGEHTETIAIPVVPLEVGTQLTVKLWTHLGGEQIVKNINVVVMIHTHAPFLS